MPLIKLESMRTTICRDRSMMLAVGQPRWRSSELQIRILDTLASGIVLKSQLRDQIVGNQPTPNQQSVLFRSTRSLIARGLCGAAEDEPDAAGRRSTQCFRLNLRVDVNLPPLRLGQILLQSDNSCVGGGALRPAKEAQRLIAASRAIQRSPKLTPTKSR
jgi:hypothetical protein